MNGSHSARRSAANPVALAKTLEENPDFNSGLFAATDSLQPPETTRSENHSVPPAENLEENPGHKTVLCAAAQPTGIPALQFHAAVESQSGTAPKNKGRVGHGIWHAWRSGW